jgi:hypothetical protein
MAIKSARCTLLPRKQTFARLDLRASPSVGLSGLIGPPDECRLVFPGHRVSIWLTFEMRQLVRSWKCFGPTYIPGSRAGLASCAGSHFTRRFILSRRRASLTRLFAMVGLMSHRRRRVFVDTPKGCRNAGFTVPETADAADVSMRLRERGWAPYRLRLDSEQHVWIAVVIDWQHAA